MNLQTVEFSVKDVQEVTAKVIDYIEKEITIRHYLCYAHGKIGVYTYNKHIHRHTNPEKLDDFISWLGDAQKITIRTKNDKTYRGYTEGLTGK